MFPYGSTGLQVVTNRPANHFSGRHSLLFRPVLDGFSKLRLETNWEWLRRGGAHARPPRPAPQLRRIETSLSLGCHTFNHVLGKLDAAS
jgi:hypothetical protein